MNTGERECGKWFQRGIKRAADIAVSALGLLVLSPLLLATALFVRLTIPGGAVFTQTRIGWRRRPFCIYKFRTMRLDEEAEEQMDLSRDEERMTAVGRFLRRTKIDELPQLFNVLWGDMSLVGPRPYIPGESEGMPAERFSMRPGLTGLAQVCGNRELSWEERTAYDIDYCRRFSLGLDVWILLRTLRVIVRGEKACVKRRGAR